jgi:hypothetical protein
LSYFRTQHPARRCYPRYVRASIASRQGSHRVVVRFSDTAAPPLPPAKTSAFGPKHRSEISTYRSPGDWADRDFLFPGSQESHLSFQPKSPCSRRNLIVRLDGSDWIVSADPASKTKTTNRDAQHTTSQAHRSPNSYPPD